jgi:membrane protease YdiL (CAAX protease family)
MSQPNFDFMPEQPAPRWGWVALIFVVGFLAVMQLVGYFGRPSGKPSLENEERQLRLTVRMNTFLSQMPGGNSSTNQASVRKGMRDLLDDVEKKRAAENADRMILALKYESLTEIEPKDWSALAKSTDPEERAIAEIYRESKLDPDRAEALASRVGTDSFVDTLIGVHAREKAALPGARKALSDPGKMAGLLSLFAILLGLGVLGFVLWPIYLGMRASDKLPAAGFSRQERNAAEANANAGRFALLLAAYFVGQAIVEIALMPAKLPEGASSLISLLLLLPLVVSMLKQPLDGFRLSRERLGFGRGEPVKNVLWGFLGFAAEIPLTFIMLIVGTTIFRFLPEASHPVTTELAGQPTLLSTIALLLLAVVWAPIFEEITFRGVLLPALAQKMRSPWGAMLLNGLIFAVIHPTGIPAWLGLASVGFVSCILVYQRGSLVPCIVMHGLHNGALMAVNLLI